MKVGRREKQKQNGYFHIISRAKLFKNGGLFPFDGFEDGKYEVVRFWTRLEGAVIFVYLFVSHCSAAEEMAGGSKQYGRKARCIPLQL
jgi:hypothetical protein